MTQYIDKSALVKEIEKRLDELYELLPNASKVESGTISISEACNTGKYTALESFKDYIDTIEVKENDLVEELDYNDYMTFFKEHPEYTNGDWGFEETWTFGQYCYKLGLKVLKGE